MAADAPRLTPSGLALLASAVILLFIAGVSGRPLPGVLAAVALAALAWSVLWAVAGARRALDLQIHLDPLSQRRPSRGKPWDLTVDLINAHSGPRGPITLEILGVGFVGEARRQLTLPGAGVGRTTLQLIFPQIGHWRLHGALISFRDPLGLTQIQRYQPQEISVTVRPATASARQITALLRPLGARRSREGKHLNRMQGHGLEIRELTHYTPGDPLKHIAWKASARRDELLVRVFEEETQRHIQLIVDIGITMRAGPPGESPLDRALDACAQIILACDRDRVGVTTFDRRIYGHLKPGRGPMHRQRLQQHLLDLNSVIDEDLTEITDAELLARVGAFLERQDRAYLRQHVEEANRPHVARAMADPLREIYDEAAVFAAVTRYLAEDRDRGHAALFAKARPAVDLLSARLRLFCALRGLPLPYRITGGGLPRGAGLQQAITQCLRPGGAETLLIFTDLQGIDPDGPAQKALRLAQRRRKHVIVITDPQGRPRAATPGRA